MAINFEPDIQFEPEEPVKPQTEEATSPLAEAAQKAVSAALPSEAAIYPVDVPKVTSPMDALKGGAEAAFQTLRDPSRISPTVSSLGQAISETKPVEAAGQALEKSTGIPAPVTKFVTAALADPQTYMGLTPGEIPSKVQKQLANLGETLSGVDAENFKLLVNKPSEVLKAEPSSVTGKLLSDAKKAAGMTDAEERVLALSDGAKKRIYRQVMERIDAAQPQTQTRAEFLNEPLAKPQGINKTGYPQGLGSDELAPLKTQPLEVGDKVIAKSTNPNLPDQELTYRGKSGAIKDPEKYAQTLRDMGVPEEEVQRHLKISGIEQYDLSHPIPQEGNPGSFHQPGSTVGATTLESQGYQIPKGKFPPAQNVPEDITVADLLKAKKAGQKIAESDPSAAGLIQKEIHQKINPLLKQMAPDIYDAQQAYHLSKVKESFMNLFPQGKGMYKYIRTIGMLGGSMFHGIGMLESPIVAGATALAGSAASKVALSPAALIQGGKALANYTRKNFPLSQENQSELQSIRDRLNNESK